MTSEQLVVAGEVIANLGQRFAGVLARVRHDLSVMLAWCLITWGIFGFNPARWAISVGAYLILSSVLAAIAGRKE